MVYAQLIMTLISLPVLVLWKIPIPLSSIIGNIIFAPVMAIYLLISSLLFVTELFDIPNALIVISLEKITDLIFYMLSYGRGEWMLYVTTSNIVILTLVPVSTLLLLRRKFETAKNKTLAFAVLFLFWVIALR